MSNKIYFNNGRQRLMSKVLHLGLSLTHRLSPLRTRRKIGQLLLTPVRRRPKPLPDGMQQQRLTVRNGEICRYSLGSGPAWLLIHGWSGAASQFFPLMEQMAAAGYTAIAYDQIGHGHSGGQQTNLPCFVHTLEDVLTDQRRRQPLCGLIAHSMGAVAALNALSENERRLPMVLLAPAFNFKQQFVDRVTQAGIPRPVLQGILEHIEAVSGLSFNQLQAENKLPDHQGPLAIIHDRQDPLAPHALSQAVAEDHQIPLISTEGFGHNRLLAAERIWPAIRELTTRGSATCH